MLVIQGVSFPLRTDTRDSAFFIYEGDGGTIDISLDAKFQKRVFAGDNAGPHVTINPIKTNKKSLPELAGMSFEVKTAEEADEREDTLYLWEHEPFENYVLTILEVTQDSAHIHCAGTAIIDGYARPCKTAVFSMDCRLPVITKAEDWDKYGL